MKKLSDSTKKPFTEKVYEKVLNNLQLALYLGEGEKLSPQEVQYHVKRAITETLDVTKEGVSSVVADLISRKKRCPFRSKDKMVITFHEKGRCHKCLQIKGAIAILKEMFEL